MPMDSHFQTANITDTSYATGQIGFTTGSFNRPYVQFPPALGGATSGFHYAPDFSTYIPDRLIMGRLPNGTWQALHYYFPNDPTQTAMISATIYMLQSGESAVLHKSGSVIHLRNDGDIVIVPANKLLLGSTGATKGVVRDGDPVSVIINGTAYAGTATSGSSTVLSS